MSGVSGLRLCADVRIGRGLSTETGGGRGVVADIARQRRPSYQQAASRQSVPALGVEGRVDQDPPVVRFRSGPWPWRPKPGYSTVVKAGRRLARAQSRA